MGETKVIPDGAVHDEGGGGDHSHSKQEDIIKHHSQQQPPSKRIEKKSKSFEPMPSKQYSHTQQKTSSKKIGDKKSSHPIPSKQYSDPTNSKQYSDPTKSDADFSPPAPSSRKLESNNANEKQPYFYYQNQTNSQHSFSLHSHPNKYHHDKNNTSLYENYGTTITIIVCLHLLYFYQWNTRRSRQDVCTSYDQLVEKKQFYRAVVAIASHPPVDGGERDTNNASNYLANNASNSNLGMVEGGGTRNGDGPITRAGNLCGRIAPMVHTMRPLYLMIKQWIFHPLMYGSLSGLPLLTFASHILWQCRSLEELYDEHDGKLILGVTGNDVNVTQFTGIVNDVTKMQTAGDAYNVEEHLSSVNDEGYTYFRVLVALAFTAILLELSLSRSILKRLDGAVNFDGYRTTPRQLLSQRAMCSIASLATALLGVYDSHFPYAPPPVLPFVRVSFLSSSGFSSIFSTMILAVLTHRIHPVTSIISGLLSGSLWSLGVTSFLGTRYWGNVMLFSLVFGMLLSLKAQPSYATYLKMFVPCIDYVAWDSDGEIPSSNSLNSPNDLSRQNSLRRISHSNSGNHEDLELGSDFPTQNRGHSSQERFPLLSSQSSSMSGGGNSNAIRGRVPLINTMESDLDDAEDMNRADDVSVPFASSPRFGASLSRRAGGSNN